MCSKERTSNVKIVLTSGNVVIDFGCYNRSGTGAGKSIVVEPQKLVESDPDWVIICPCGLDIEETKRELNAITGLEWW